MRDNGNRQHGSEKEPEPDDPMELVMHRLPGADPVRMAKCFIEEYAILGLGHQEILELFKQPIYQTHELYRHHGEDWVRELIDEVLRQTGRFRVSIQYLDPTGGCNG
ncbi:MAG: hypothetical protein AB1898_03095 [Acidobacteriota bacterium]